MSGLPCKEIQDLWPSCKVNKGEFLTFRENFFEIKLYRDKLRYLNHQALRPCTTPERKKDGGLSVGRPASALKMLGKWENIGCFLPYVKP